MAWEANKSQVRSETDTRLKEALALALNYLAIFAQLYQICCIKLNIFELHRRHKQNEYVPSEPHSS